MARIKKIQALRTTRAALNAQKAANGLLQGEPYLITDESRLAVGTAVNDYADMATRAELDAKAATAHTHTLAQITDAVALIKNYASVAQGDTVGNAADPDRADEPVKLIRHANMPGGAVYYWHVTTTFYLSRTSTSNRGQIAVQYNAGNQVWARSIYSGIWTPWVRLDNAGMAPLANPALTGTPTAPTAAAGTSTTQLATTAFVQQASAPAPVVVTANATVVLTGLRAVYACNTQAGSFTLTLPASPAAGTIVKVRDYKSTFAVNNLTVARNGKNILGLAEDYILDVSNYGREFVYVDATMGWSVQ